MIKQNKNEVNTNSNYNLKNNKFNSNGGEIHIGDKIHQEIKDNSVSYELNIQDNTFIENFSKYITKKLGDKKVAIWGLIELITGLISVFSSLNSFFDNISFTWLPNFPKTIGIIFLIVGIILLLAGVVFLNSLKYKKDTTCEKCNKEYAYLQYKNPLVREVETREGTRKNIIEYLECRYCHDKIERKHHKIIPYEEESDI